MAGAKRSKPKDGGRSEKKSQAARKDIAARKAGDTAGRAKSRGGVPKAERPGNQGGRAGGASGGGGRGPQTHKNFDELSLASGDARKEARGNAGKARRGTDNKRGRPAG